MAFPSKEQRFVIEHRGHPLVVVAGPGTGKTQTLVARMIDLLKDDSSRNVSFITFTRTSRRDTWQKIEEALGKGVLEETEVQVPRISTLHAYSKWIVHRYSAKIGRNGNFTILIEDKGEKALLLKELISDLSLQLEIQQLNEGIKCFRSTNKWSSDFKATPSECDQILKYFDSLLFFYNTFDIEGLVATACKILEDSTITLPSIYLQIDEYQDLNPSDQRFVKLIASNRDSQVVVVGDDAQSIYGFRYANYNGLRDLWESPDWKSIPFLDCHRLPAHVQNAAQALIGNEGYLGCNLKPRPDEGRKILTLQCTKNELQLNCIAKLISNFKVSKRKKDGQPLTYKDFMVLCPTSGFVKIIANKLQSEFNIPTKQQYKASIPEDHWKLLLILRMLYSEDSLAFRQWLPFAGFSWSEISSIRREAMKRNRSLYDYCRILDDVRVKDVYNALNNLKSNLNNFVEFRKALLKFPNLFVQEELFPEIGLTIDEANQKPRSIVSVINFIYEKFGLIESEADIPEEDKVLVATLHSAKGLEAEFVFVTHMNSKFMPLPIRDSKEEIRVFYVALTRAAQDVILLFHEVFDQSCQRLLCEEAMSPFLLKIKDFLNVKRVRKKDIC
jgi:DNA helicase-2/ATP-dependent DNA helicase PcrA